MNTTLYTIRYHCPHCGTHQKHIIDLQNNATDDARVVYCDLEQGGCDTQLAVFTEITAIATARTIDGLKPR